MGLAIFARLALVATDRLGAVHAITTVGFALYGVQIIGFLLIVGLIWQVERTIRARHARVSEMVRPPRS